MLTGNKGEWSEVYTFFKLLVDKKIYGANQDLERIDAVVFPIIKIIREEASGISEYELRESDAVNYQDPGGNNTIIDSSDLKLKVREIFESIKGGEKTFTIPMAEELFERYGIHSLNAGNSRKEDLVLKIYDHVIGGENESGFSIKSRLGSPATLLNASAATNFTYKITNLQEEKISEINAIQTKAKIRDRLSAIRDAGGMIQFYGVDSPVFKSNLEMIDTIMPEIVAEVLLAYYLVGGSTFPELINHLDEDGIQITTHSLSRERMAYKLKELLSAAALGMVPASEWNGIPRAHGGVIIVKEDGEIVCYHLYNAEAFKNYLLKNTRLDSPSATRHGYGAIYEENGELFIKLNLQIRFIK